MAEDETVIVHVPDAVSGSESADSDETLDGDDAMAEGVATPVPQVLAEQAVGRQLSTNSIAADHNQQFNKILDLNYEMDRKVVNLVQALGVREVTSESGQKGVPLSGAKAGGV